MGFSRSRNGKGVRGECRRDAVIRRDAVKAVAAHGSHRGPVDRDIGDAVAAVGGDGISLGGSMDNGNAAGRRDLAMNPSRGADLVLLRGRTRRDEDRSAVGPGGRGA